MILEPGVGRAPVDFTGLVPHQVLPRDEADRVLVALPGPGTVVDSSDGTTRRVEAGMATLAVGGPYAILLDDGRSVDDVLVGDLWALAGQSNMMGGAPLDGAPVAVDGARSLGVDGRWQRAADPLHRLWQSSDNALLRVVRVLSYAELDDRSWEELVHANTARDRDEPIGGVGPGASFAEELVRLTGIPVGLLPCALGGTSLDAWQRRWADGAGARFEDSLFGNLVTRARWAGPLRGVLWYQGEADATPDAARTYGRRFAELVHDVRVAAAQPDLPFLTVQLGTLDLDNVRSALGIVLSAEGFAGWAAVREAQRLAAETIPGVAVVASADLSLVDGIHLDRASQVTLGKRLAAVAACVSEGRAGPLPRVAAAAAAPDRQTVCVRVSGLGEGLRISGPCDVDLDDPARIVSLEVWPPDVLVLRLDRPLGPAATITYGPGLQPTVGLTDGQGLPVPLFGPVPL